MLLLVAATVTACREDTVRLSFRPEVGDVYRYEVVVRSRSEVRLPGVEPEVREEEVVLQSEHTVLEADDDGVRVQVILGDASGSVRTFVVRFDRAAQLEAVEADDALVDASSDADPFGISEIFPAASGTPGRSTSRSSSPARWGGRCCRGRAGWPSSACRTAWTWPRS
jgi:hypothetical protein